MGFFVFYITPKNIIKQEDKQQISDNPLLHLSNKKASYKYQRFIGAY